MENILMIITTVIIVFVAYIYSILTKARNMVEDSYSKMDISLKKRWDLIPQLVDVLKEDSTFDGQTIEKLTELKKQDFNKFKMKQKLEIDNNISKVVKKIIEMSEKYPTLKSNELYINFSKQLMDLDKEIQNNIDEYVKNSKEYNQKIEIVPNNLVAILFGFNEETC